MKKVNTSELAFDNDNLLLSIANGYEDFCDNYSEQLSDYDEALNDYKWMLQMAIECNDKEEIKIIRSEIQHLKVEKRRAKKVLANKNKGVLAYS